MSRGYPPRILRIALTAMLLAGALFVAASPARAAGSPGLGIALAPERGTGASTDPRSQIYIADVVKPGATLTRSFTVTNGTDAPLPVEMYADGAAVTGGSFVPADGRTANQLTEWTTVTPDSATVPAHGQVSGTVTVRVPMDAAVGERYGVVLAQYTAPPVGATIQVARTGIRMYLYVAGPATPISDFEITSVRTGTSALGPVISVGLLNTGSRVLDFTGAVDLAGPQGRKAGPLGPASALTLAPGDRGDLSFVSDKKVNGGPWQVTATIRADQITHVGSATLSFSGLLPAHQPPHHRPAWVLWFAVLALFLVLILFVAMWRVLSERERTTPFPAAGSEPMPKPAARDAASPRR